MISGQLRDPYAVWLFENGEIVTSCIEASSSDNLFHYSCHHCLRKQYNQRFHGAFLYFHFSFHSYVRIFLVFHLLSVLFTLSWTTSSSLSFYSIYFFPPYFFPINVLVIFLLLFNFPAVYFLSNCLSPYSSLLLYTAVFMPPF